MSATSPDPIAIPVTEVSDEYEETRQVIGSTISFQEQIKENNRQMEERLARIAAN